MADPNLIVPEIGRAVYAPDRAEGLSAEALQEHIRDRELVLILDNFEHLLEGAPLLGGLLAGCPRLKLLVTSRALLHLAGISPTCWRSSPRWRRRPAIPPRRLVSSEAEALREQLKVPLSPSEREAYDRRVLAARTKLDGTSFALAWAWGRSMSLDEAVDYALDGMLLGSV